MADEIPANEDVSQFGRLMRQHRLRIGLTQRELADFSTISVRAIRDLEQGKATRPRQDTVRLIAEGLRLGPRARVALEVAANRGLAGRALKEYYDSAPPAPPAALDPIVGRASETAVITDELGSGTERLVTIVGLGGTGKTRLALNVAHRLHAQSRMPVLWHAFSGASACYHHSGGIEGMPALLSACVDELFGAEVSGGIQAFVELVGDRPALLVADGAGVAAPCPDRLARLLHDCPEVRVLVTADRPGGVAGERIFLLAPLETPGTDEEAKAEVFVQVPAVRLFLDLVGKAGPGGAGADRQTALVADICRSLDGLPLALRAAASWLLVYDLTTLRRCLAAGPAELLDHLSGAESGSGLREALDRCVGRLDPPDRDLLTALCRRDGGFGLEDVAELTGLSMPDSGRVVRGLMLYGLVRTSQEVGRPPFRVLHLVQAVVLTDRRLTAPGMPDQLPFVRVRRVSHGIREGVMP
ncbi:MAG: helix-turn-helix domain-containing protein [Streptosporangiaceae bacterium]